MGPTFAAVCQADGAGQNEAERGGNERALHGRLIEKSDFYGGLLGPLR
jgi:hypothetical protein